MWQTTGKNERRSAAPSGDLWRVILPRQTHLQAARLANHRPCSRTKDFNRRPKPVRMFRSRRDERDGLPERLQVNTLRKDVTHWLVYYAFVGRRTRNAESRVRRANH